MPASFGSFRGDMEAQPLMRGSSSSSTSDDEGCLAKCKKKHEEKKKLSVKKAAWNFVKQPNLHNAKGCYKAIKEDPHGTTWLTIFVLVTVAIVLFLRHDNRVSNKARAKINASINHLLNRSANKAGHKTAAFLGETSTTPAPRTVIHYVAVGTVNDPNHHPR